MSVLRRAIEKSSKGDGRTGEEQGRGGKGDVKSQSAGIENKKNKKETKGGTGRRQAASERE